jgi:hypothetical protein
MTGRAAPADPTASRSTTLATDDGRLITLELPAATSDADAPRDFIADHWVDLAAASHLGFKRFGIGAVVVQAREQRHEGVEMPFDAHDMHYARDHGPWMQDREAQLPAAWLDAQLQRYDPRTTALLLFPSDGNRTDAPVTACAASGEPAPPEAFQQVRAQQN